MGHGRKMLRGLSPDARRLALMVECDNWRAAAAKVKVEMDGLRLERDAIKVHAEALEATIAGERDLREWAEAALARIRDMIHANTPAIGDVTIEQAFEAILESIPKAPVAE